MSKKNPYYDEEGTGDTPLIEELIKPVLSPTPEVSKAPEVVPTPIVKETPVVESLPIPKIVVAPEAVPIPVVQVPLIPETVPIPVPLKVPMPSPKSMPVPLKEATPKNPSRPRIPEQDIKEELVQEKKEIYVPPVVPQGFKEVVESTPARQRAERTKFNFTPEPLSVEDDGDRAIIPEVPEEEVKSKGLFKIKKINPYAGGRWKVLAIRYSIWVVMAFIILGGIKTVILPSKANIPALTQAIGAQLNINGFPIQSGQDLARSFTREYLTINPKARDQRATNLSHFLPSGVDQAGWTGVSSNVSETVIAGPILVESPNLVDKTHAVFTFSAEVKAGSSAPVWVYLAVTVFADSNGLVTISGPPAFTNNPGFAINDGAFPFAKSQSATDSLGVDLPGFFKAWAASDSTGLSLYTQSDAKPNVTNGLNHSVSFVSLNNLSVQAVNIKKVSSAYGSRYAEVDVTWQANGNVWVQAYRLTVLQASDKKWYIQDIFAGGFGALKQ